MKKIISTLLLICAITIAFSGVKSQAYADEYCQGKAMAVYEGNSGTLLYKKNAYEHLAIASTTKIITCIVAIENYADLDKEVNVSDKAVGIEGTSIYLKKGEVIKFKDLLYGLMLASGNDCAVAIAEEVAGEEKFVAMMNDYARRCGAYNTHFVNPHGLDADGHYSCAVDMAIMTSKALDNPIFKEIVSTKYHSIEPTNVYQKRFLKHKNRILFNDENCVGVKTGFTDNAGRCLVSASEKDGMRVVSVVLNCQPMFEECVRLDKLAYNEYCYKQFVVPYTYVGTIYVEKGEKDEVGLSTTREFATLIKRCDEELFRVEYNIPETITAPVELNQEVGSVKVYKGDEEIYSAPLYTIDNIKNIDFRYMMDNIINKWF